MERDKAIKYFKLAKYMAELFSKDSSTKVGAIAIAPDTLHIKSIGYNGFPRKIRETEEKWKKPTKYQYVVHAEANLICNASLNGISLENSILVVTKFPCNECAKLIIQSGIKHIISESPNFNSDKWGESSKISLEMFKELNINVVLLEDSEII